VKELAATAAIRAWIVDGNHCLICLIDARKVGLASVLIRRFDPSYSAQGVFWFSEDKDKILRGESGAVSAKHLIEVHLRVNKTAGWNEYDRYSLAELENLGYDSLHLDDDWVIFDPAQITIVGTNSKARRRT